MKPCRLAAVLLSAAFVVTPTQSADAQQAEVGASLITAAKVIDDGTFVSVPSGSLGSAMTPGIYSSFFLGSRIAVEPRLGLLWISEDGDSFHVLNFSGQLAYFLLGSGRPSPYVFANGGFIEVGDESFTPKTFGAGAGYRMPTDGRLVFRLEGGWTRITGEFEEDEDMVTFSVSIGGLFR